MCSVTSKVSFRVKTAIFVFDAIVIRSNKIRAALCPLEEKCS
jgi:hypothetical protein